MNITLKQLRYFEAVVKQRHFGRAAETCSISQPALSMQIKELEASLGAPLFERDTRQIRLTGLGEAVRDRVRNIMTAVDELQDLARAQGDPVAGRLRLGIIPTIAPYLLPAIVTDLAAHFPGLDLHFRETTTSKLLTELAEGHLDAAILALPVSEPSLVEVALFSEQFVFVRPAADADQPIPAADKLKQMRLLLLEEGHCFRDQALAFCQISATAPRAGLDGSNLSTLVQMVGSGLGVTLIPEMAVEIETASAPVSTSHFQSPSPSRTIGMIWRKSTPMSEGLHQIADIVRIAGQRHSKTDQTQP